MAASGKGSIVRGMAEGPWTKWAGEDSWDEFALGGSRRLESSEGWDGKAVAGCSKG